MNKYQAEKIINKYGESIVNNKGLFRKQSTLPCSKAKIRYAFYVYIAAIINDLGRFPKDIGQNLAATYSMLDCFVSDEEADRLNRIPEMIKNKQLNAEKPNDEKQIKEYFSLVTNALRRNGSYFDEINDYIGECYKEKGIRS
ncbi:MAG: hypothetical protein HZA09_01390 [Nitrospirae bacterium]|nr:hypothetical protein [Nitrospirota bacterium]